MHSRLETIKDWENRAVQSNFRVARLAESCGVTSRTLNRFLTEKVGMPPRAWFTAMRMGDALKGATKGELMKNLATEARYSQQTNFTRRFKEYYGFVPSRVRRLSVNP
jgi:AraC-like DNA-binding protein